MAVVLLAVLILSVFGTSAEQIAVARSSAVGSRQDPLLPKQWGLARIEAPDAWRLADGKEASIAVLDTGVDLTHPDLNTKIVKRKSIDVVEPSGSEGPQDENSHGTLVAGIAAAITGNGIGIAGVAPRAKILAIRVCDENGSCEDEDIANGILYAARKGANVINLSLGLGYVTSRSDLGSGPIDLAAKKAWEKGAVIVAAAGNEGLPLCREPADTPAAPVLCVGATDKDDLLAFYSNSDAAMRTLYLVAPGGSGLNALAPGSDCEGGILSTYLRSAEPSPCAVGDSYDVASGTSLAVPFVSGVAALLASIGLTNEEILETVISTTDDLGLPGRDPTYGYGLVNAREAVSSATSASTSGNDSMFEPSPEQPNDSSDGCVTEYIQFVASHPTDLKGVVNATLDFLVFCDP